MLRDVPWIYAGMYLGIVFVVGMSMWFTNQYARGASTLTLNEALQTSATTEYDPSIRVYKGVYVPGDAFETAVWEKISHQFPKGSKVQFDYIFDETKFYTVGYYYWAEEPPDWFTASSPIYYIDGDESEKPSMKRTEHLYQEGIKLPVMYMRVKVALPNDKVDEWTYISTIEIEAYDNEGDDDAPIS